MFNNIFKIVNGLFFRLFLLGKGFDFFFFDYNIYFKIYYFWIYRLFYL